MTRSIGKGKRPRITLSGPQNARVLSQPEVERLLYGCTATEAARPGRDYEQEAAREARARIEAANQQWNQQVSGSQQPIPGPPEPADSPAFSTRRTP